MKRIVLLILVLILSLCSCKKKGDSPIGDDKKEQVEVTYLYNGEKDVSSYDEGSLIKLPILQREHYVFMGWKLGNTIYDGDYLLGKEDITFEASFIQSEFRVRFFYDDDEVEAWYEEGDVVDLSFVPEKDGYIFNGWAKDDVIVDAFIMEASNVDFEASYSFDYINNAIKKIMVPVETIENISLPTSIEECNISWNSNKKAFINNEGTVLKRDETDVVVTLTATITHGDEKSVKTYTVTLNRYSDKEILDNAVNSYTFNSTINNGKVSLKTSFSTKSNITCVWLSKNSDIINDDGEIIKYPTTDKEVCLELNLALNNEKVTKEYKFTIKGLNVTELLNTTLESINLGSYVTKDDLELQNEFPYNIKATWTSSNTDIISNDGLVKDLYNYNNVKLSVSLKMDGEEATVNKDFNLTLHPAQPKYYSTDFNEENFNNVKLDENNKLVLVDGATYGEYESDELSVLPFTTLCPTWCAVSSTCSTVEFLIKARVNGVWDEYISYCPGGWGQGLENASKDVTKTLSKLVDDEFMILSSKASDCVKFKLIIRRTDSSCESAKVSMVTLALKGSTYTGETYDLTKLPKSKVYDVPHLYQGDVPTIGGSICSCTSSTMLLKYRGMSFLDKDSLEHRYIAGIVRDYGNNIYGNWVYNCVGMASFGFDAYVGRLYSINELVYHLATVGPCAISVKGQMTSDLKDYSTNGHLLDIVGYEIADNGLITFIANDPNVRGGSCRYSQSVIKNVWRMIIYAI